MELTERGASAREIEDEGKSALERAIEGVLPGTQGTPPGRRRRPPPAMCAPCGFSSPAASPSLLAGAPCVPRHHCRLDVPPPTTHARSRAPTIPTPLARLLSHPPTYPPSHTTPTPPPCTLAYPHRLYTCSPPIAAAADDFQAAADSETLADDLLTRASKQADGEYYSMLAGALVEDDDEAAASEVSESEEEEEAAAVAEAGEAGGKRRGPVLGAAHQVGWPTCRSLHMFGIAWDARCKQGAQAGNTCTQQVLRAQKL